MSQHALDHLKIWNSPVSTYSDKEKVAVSGRALIVNNARDRILLLKRSSTDSFPNHWEPPGGGIESHETIGEGIEREAKEESGIKLPEPDELVLIRPPMERHQKKPLMIISMLFVMLGPITAIVSEEHTEWMLATRDEIRSGDLLMRFHDREDCDSVLQ